MKPFRKNADYAAFLRVLAEALERHPSRLLGYCIIIQEQQKPGVSSRNQVSGTVFVDEVSFEGKTRGKNQVSGTVFVDEVSSGPSC
jgi:hypothetical protein